MIKIFYIKDKDLPFLINSLCADYKVFSPLIKEIEGEKTDYSYNRLFKGDIPRFSAYRAVEPLKTFFTSPLEKVSGYFKEGVNFREPEKIVIFGVKSCDIQGHKVQDFVFLEGQEKDSLYRARRENTVLISGDCTDFKNVCHCLAWEVLPHPTVGFDLNLSPLNDGYIVESGSDRGEAFIQRYKDYFVPAKETQVLARKAKRESFIERLRKHLLPQGLVSKAEVQRLMKDGYSADTWQKFMLTCVECAGCNLICDTCHCFLLSDEKDRDEFSRLKGWDCCQYTNFSRVAGGANPLKTRTQRLRNRFIKKFDFFIDNMGIPACCGCGRCIEVCPGKIDIREVLKDVKDKVSRNK
ncbi:MAG: 4Fe-4S dicluster domain-containing protein [Candidatus Omnitrophota bacterium]|nr:4Fe-4S dicluster domain-containing protein [Candidatus Omnitrophota bacterium]MBU1929296.1 4Fe-4S dicluster domain-containing protein [Candidatus Omnitrophota bacterium]MBU2035588.1 4Fe-4S dicluster domain-containing protein [Candidatus Omnitrophota bacterium]MBU2222164.1 4Fe-4S dicluster domain-containing protein [Candidatus Omnitrophota bacterium]MBU2258404.1 4Fe-4S dicluster domain-containing protein [Candidatus Omnitrophota bacterium]